MKQLTGRVGGGTKDVGGVTVGGEGGLRGGGGTGSLRKERDGRAGSGQRTGDGGRTKSAIAIIPKGFNPRNALESAPAPHRAARSDPTRAWIQIIWSVDNANRAFTASRRAWSGGHSR